MVCHAVPCCHLLCHAAFCHAMPWHDMAWYGMAFNSAPFFLRRIPAGTPQRVPRTACYPLCWGRGWWSRSARWPRCACLGAAASPPSARCSRRRWRLQGGLPALVAGAGAGCRRQRRRRRGWLWPQRRGFCTASGLSSPHAVAARQQQGWQRRQAQRAATARGPAAAAAAAGCGTLLKGSGACWGPVEGQGSGSSSSSSRTVGKRGCRACPSTHTPNSSDLHRQPLMWQARGLTKAPICKAKSLPPARHAGRAAAGGGGALLPHALIAASLVFASSWGFVRPAFSLSSREKGVSKEEAAGRHGSCSGAGFQGDGAGPG